MKHQPMKPARGWMIIDINGNIAVIHLYSSRQKASSEKWLNERAVPVEIRERGAAPGKIPGSALWCYPPAVLRPKPRHERIKR